MLPNWFECYDKKFITLLSAINLNGNEDDRKCFIELAKEILAALFKSGYQSHQNEYFIVKRIKFDIL